MRSRRSYLFGAALCALTTAGMTSPVHAEADSSASTATAVVETIVVTARKRSENLQEVPGSVQAIVGDALRTQRITDVQILSQHVPSFTQSIAGPNPRYYLRGVGSGSNASFEQAVGTFVDDIYVGRGVEGRMPYYDLEDVTVQLGPQVVLYGNSTTGGAISIVTHRPTGTFSAELDAAYEFKNHETTLQGDVNLPLSDKVRVRIAGYTDDLNYGWLTTSRPNITPANITHDPRVHDKAARVSVQFLPTDELDVLLKYEVADTKNRGGTLQIVSNPLLFPFVESNFDLFREAGNANPPFPAKSEDQVRLNSQTFLAAINYKVAGGTLTSTTGYNRYDYDADIEGDMSRIAAFDFGQFEKYKQFSQEVRFASNLGSKLDYIAGAYYQRNTLGMISRTDVNPASLFPFAAFNRAFAGFNGFPAFARTTYLNQTETDYSVFADVTYHLTDRLKVELGARYTQVKKSGAQGAHASSLGTTTLNPAFDTPAAFLPPVGVPAIPGSHHSFYSLVFAVPHDLPDLTLKEDHFMPEALVQYELGENSMIYAKAVQGAKSGGFDWLYGGDATSFTAKATGTASATFRPETATSYETGFRGEGFERKLLFGVTAYENKVEDLQVSVFNGGTNFVVGNANTRSRGIEGNFTYRPWAPLTLTGVASYTDSIFTSFKGAGCTFAQSVVFVRTPTQATCTQDLSGVHAPVPKLMYNLGATYLAEVGDYRVRSELHLNYRGPYNFSDANEPLLRRKAVTLLDARIGVEPKDGHWDASIFAKNLTDERWSDVGAAPPLVSGATFADTQRPLQVGLQFRVRSGN